MTVKFGTRWAVRADGALVGIAGRGPRRRGAPLPTGLTPTARRWRAVGEHWRAVCRQASGERDDGQIRNPLGGSCGWCVGWDCWPRPRRRGAPLPAGLTPTARRWRAFASSGERCAVRPPGSGIRVKFETRWAVRADGALVGMAGRGPRRRGTPLPTGLTPTARRWRARRALASSGERCAVRPPGSGMTVKFRRPVGRFVRMVRWLGCAGRGPRRRWGSASRWAHAHRSPLASGWRAWRALASGVPSGLRGAG